MRGILFLITLVSLTFTSKFGHTQAAVYMTAADFGKEATIVYTEVVLTHNSLIFTTEDGGAKVFNLKKERIWGYRNNFGEDFRIKKGGKALRIIEYGSICIYSNLNDISTTSNPDLNSSWKDNPYALTNMHSFSIGVDGKVIKFSDGRFLKALKDNPVVYQKFEKLILAGCRDLLLKVVEHNSFVR